MKQLVGFALSMFSGTLAMQNPLAQLDTPKALSFLYAYATAKICDLNEKEVFFDDSADFDVSYYYTWGQALEILNKAYQDLAQFDVKKIDTKLKEDYRSALLKIQESLDPELIKECSENRIRYRNAWMSGEYAQIKVALKLQLWPK